MKMYNQIKLFVKVLDGVSLIRRIERYVLQMNMLINPRFGEGSNYDSVKVSNCRMLSPEQG
jgi:hypothetical protein